MGGKQSMFINTHHEMKKSRFIHRP